MSGKMRARKTHRGRRKNVRRRSNRRGARRGKISTLVLKGPSIVPDRMFTKLKYNLTRTLDPAPAAATVTYAFRGNSLYDPEYSVGGQQPMGYDQWTALYNQYRVHASSISIKFMSTSSTEAGGFTKIVLFPSTTPASGSYSGNNEQPYSRSIFLANNGINQGYLRGKMLTKKMLGIKSVAYDEDLAGVTGSDPAKQWYWILYGSSINDLANIAGVYMDIKVTYFTEFFGRVQLARS